MATIRMIDIAVNFTDGMFKGIYNGRQCHVSDIASVLCRAWSAGFRLEELREALAIAETDVGVHPTRCKEFEESGDPEKHFQTLLLLAKEGIQKGKVVAVRECGWIMTGFVFSQQRFKRTATDFCEIVERNKDRFAAGVSHSFTGSAEDCVKLLSFDNMYIGINSCSLKTGENLDVVKGIPVERMMIETDSPNCEIKNTYAGIGFVKSTWPSKKKEKYDQECIFKGRNEPCLVRKIGVCQTLNSGHFENYVATGKLYFHFWQVLEVVAGCKGINDMRSLGRTLYHNTCRVFFPHDLDSAADALLADGSSS